MSKEKEIYHFVEFSFSIASRGKNNNELREYAVNDQVEDHYDIFKDLIRNPENTEIGEEIHEAELYDYFWYYEEE